MLTILTILSFSTTTLSTAWATPSTCYSSSWPPSGSWDTDFWHTDTSQWLIRYDLKVASMVISNQTVYKNYDSDPIRSISVGGGGVCLGFWSDRCTLYWASLHLKKRFLENSLGGLMSHTLSLHYPHSLERFYTTMSLAGSHFSCLQPAKLICF